MVLFPPLTSFDLATCVRLRSRVLGIVSSQSIRGHAAGSQSYQRPVAQSLADESNPLPAAGRNQDALRRDDYSTFMPKNPAEKDILHQAQLRKSAQALKYLPA
jgi:hypothetical protein